MNIFKRMYNWVANEIRMIYEDFKDGYVKMDIELLDILVVGSALSVLTVLSIHLIGIAGDMAL